MLITAPNLVLHTVLHGSSVHRYIPNIHCVRYTLIFLLLLATGFRAGAQRWRAEVSGGVHTPALLAASKFTKNPSPYSNDSLFDLPNDRGVPQAVWGLKLMRRDSAFEYGIAMQLHKITIDEQRSYEMRGRRLSPEQRLVLASPAIPLTAFLNYTHHRSAANAYIGVNAGVVFAIGKDMMDAQGLQYYQDYEVYFHNGTGYTYGIQCGFRRTFGKLDAGLQLGMNFLHLPLTQGVTRHEYTYRVLTLPVQAYVGYTF